LTTTSTVAAVHPNLHHGGRYADRRTGTAAAKFHDERDKLILGHGDAHITLKVYAHVFNRDKRDEAVRRALSAPGAW
jgi:hypothetical protein